MIDLGGKIKLITETAHSSWGPYIYQSDPTSSRGFFQAHEEWLENAIFLRSDKTRKKYGINQHLTQACFEDVNNLAEIYFLDILPPLDTLMEITH